VKIIRDIAREHAPSDDKMLGSGEKSADVSGPSDVKPNSNQ
jgi:hypothetical protein